jgi:capsid protein
MNTPRPSEILAREPWYEHALAAVAPQWANRRLVARIQRELFRYQAAASDRIYSPRTSGNHAESPTTKRERVVMAWEAMDLVENFTFAKAAVRKFSTFVTPTEYAPATGDRKFDALLSEYFHDWCKRCDARGTHAFAELIGLACEMRPVWGDCGFVVRRRKKELRLELVGGERIGNPNESVREFPNYISGIVTDDSGAPEAYRIFEIDPASSQWVNPQDVKASNFLHYFDPFRVDQMRGVTDFHAALRPARMLKEILEAELIGVRFASSQAALVYNERGTAPTRNAFTSASAVALANGEMPKDEETAAGTIKYLKHGDSVQVMPGRPSSAFTGFVDEVKHEIALGLGSYPAGILWGTANYKGPSVRAEFAQADRANDRNQRILENRVLRRVAEMVTLNAIAEGDIPMPERREGEEAVDTLKRATRGSFRFPPRLTIDVGRESQARLAELSMGVISQSEIAAEDGRDAYVRADERAQFAAHCRDLAKQYDIPETSIFLPAGQQLPNTPAMAASVGESAGEAAAEAQADSVPSKPSTEAALSAKLSRLLLSKRKPAAIT